MLGRMIGGGGYQSARDGLFGSDPLANGGIGGAINRPQEMMAAQPEQKKGLRCWSAARLTAATPAADTRSM